MKGQGSILALSPSFNSYSSTRFAEIAAKVSDEFCQQREELGLDAAAAAFSKQISITTEPPCSSKPKPEHEFEFEQDQKHHQEEEEQVRETQKKESDDSDSDDFEFALVNKDTDSSPPISADEIFYNGQIKPIYPVFNRNLIFATGRDDDDVVNNAKDSENTSNRRFPLGKLFMEEEDRDPPSSSSSEADDLEAVPAGTYCVWTPNSVQASPDRCKKSSSTGSSSKRWRFRDFLHRSNSDGKETFVFLARSASGSKSKKKEENNVSEKSEAQQRRISMDNSNTSSKVTATTGKPRAKRVSGEATRISAHETHYIRNRAVKESDRRKSYLPYRQDLVGLFANVNGLNRNIHPF